MNLKNVFILLTNFLFYYVLKKGGGALPQVRVTNLRGGVFGTLNWARKLIFFLLVRFFHNLVGFLIPEPYLPYHDLQVTSTDL